MPKATIQQGSNKEIKDVLKVVSMLVELQDKKERNDNVYVQKEYAEKRQHLIKNVQTELQTSANHKLSEKYDILLGTKIYDIIQDLKQNTAKYLSRPAYDYQFETYQFGAIIGAGLFYGIYEYLKDNTISGKTRKDMQALESAIKEFKTTSLDCILSSRGQPIPYYFDNGVLFKRWVEEYFNKIPSKKHIDVQQQVISCFYRSNNLPVAINNDEIRFLQKIKGWWLNMPSQKYWICIWFGHCTISTKF